ncbi:MAG TPA: lasso peptide biosynthesis B2 protein [Acidobacteriaceae bacterium]|nr:lasso peptide biosynthesis B2 protein [Acidobacteriaceae bacterium]
MASLSNFSIVMEAWVLLWVCRIGLWLAPFPRVLAGVQYCAEHYRSSRPVSPEQVSGSIVRALGYTWHASCLTQALAGWIILTRHGTESRVRIGVSSPEKHGFKAHAWLEAGGRVILGDSADEPGLDSYHVIWTLPRE